MRRPSAWKPTTRLGIQAVVALLIIEVLSRWVNLPRSNWASMAAISVLCQTWGESLRKSGQRIFATIGGLTVGVFLHELLQAHISLELTAIMFCLFLMTYYSVVSYATGMFFLSVMLALMFGVTGASVEQMYWQRIVATLVCGTVALLISMLVLPTRTRLELHREMKAYLDDAARSYLEGLKWLMHPDAPQPMDWPAARRQHFTRLRTQYTTYLNEAAIRRAPANEMKTWMVHLAFMHLYQSQFEHVVFGNQRNPETRLFRAELEVLAESMEGMFRYLAAQMEGAAKATPPGVEQTVRPGLRAAMVHRAADPACRRGDLLDLLPLFYFSWKMANAGRPDSP